MPQLPAGSCSVSCKFPDDPHCMFHNLQIRLHIPGFQGMVCPFCFVKRNSQFPAARPDFRSFRPWIRCSVKGSRLSACKPEGILHRGEKNLFTANPMLPGIRGAHYGPDALSDEQDLPVFVPRNVSQDFLRLFQRRLRALPHLLRRMPQRLRKRCTGTPMCSPSQTMTL